MLHFLSNCRTIKWYVNQDSPWIYLARWHWLLVLCSISLMVVCKLVNGLPTNYGSCLIIRYTSHSVTARRPGLIAARRRPKRCLTGYQLMQLWLDTNYSICTSRSNGSEDSTVFSTVNTSNLNWYKPGGTVAGIGKLPDRFGFSSIGIK